MEVTHLEPVELPIPGFGFRAGMAEADRENDGTMTEIAGPTPHDDLARTGRGPTAAKGRRVKAPRPRFGWGRRALVAVMLVSLAIAALAWIQVLPAAIDGLTKTPLATPGSDEMHLTPGLYAVFERTGTQSGGGGITFSENNSPKLAPRDVTVTGPSGEQVTTRYMSSNQSLNRNGKLYTGVIEFTVTEAGQYTVAVTRVTGEVVVTRSLLDGQAGNVIVGVMSGLTFVFSTAGLVLATIVVSTRRTRARRAAWSAPAPPTIPPPPPPYRPEGSTRDI